MTIPYKKLILLTLGAFLIRAAVFSFYVQHEQRYCQPDTPDYHISGITLCLGKGMIRFGTPFPFFWRAPGYPWFLSHFFRAHGVTNLSIEANEATHKSALWMQIALSSTIPAILFILALFLTSSLFIAWVVAWISTVHPGFVLASTFLLTEALALIFFFLFLLAFYRMFSTIGEPKKESSHWLWYAICAGLLLGITTWIRPMGEYVAVVSAIIIFLFANSSWWKKVLMILVLLGTFVTTLSPWIMRNYKLTHKVFFCPMMGAYLNAFIAPRVLRDVQNRPLDDTFRELQQKAGKEIQKDYVASQGTDLAIVPEQIPLRVALPIIKEHPWFAAYEWIKEVMKSTFDLYSWQLVALEKKCFRSDPLEEFLAEKTAQCLYKDSLSWLTRSIAWLELLYVLLLWIGIFFGFWYFLLRTAFKRYNVSDHLKKMGGLWLKTGFMIGSILCMTGGFGYARLRLPVEPLLLILSLTAWLELRNFYRQRKEAL